MPKILLLLVSWILCQDALAYQQFPVDTLKLISRDPVWLKLMRYERNSSTESGLKSAVKSPTFFISGDGRVNPLTELKATIEAFYRPVQVADDHAICRFRGRYLWLNSKLKLDGYGELPEVDCKKFNAWSLGGKTDSISIVYATGYLGNPASYYGHTLIKLNSSNSQVASKLLDASVNYGAIVPDNENPVAYIFKGLIGGYDAGFTNVEYYYHTHNYGENELRDLWEYKLNLTQDEVDLVLGHTWELLGKKFTYLFMDKNCAYRMAEIFEVIEGVEITDEEEPWFLPQTVVQRLYKSSRNGYPIVESIEYLPSRQSRLNEKFVSLTSNQRSLVRSITENILFLEKPEFIEESLASKYQILDVLLDYYQAFNVNNGKEHYARVLQHRYRLPPGVVDNENYAPVAPHLARKPSWSQVKVLHNRALGDGLGMTLRPAYYDQLDSGGSHVKFAVLSMLSMTVVALNDQLRIRNLDLIDISNVKMKATGLSGDRRWAWKLKAGMESQDLACEGHCLISYATADRGYSYSPDSSSLLVGYLGAGVQDSRSHSGNIFLRATGAMIWDLSASFRVKLQVEHREYQDGSKKSRDKFSFSGRYQFSDEADFRLSFKKDRSEELTIGIGYYW